jgi:hypothetical protein
MRSRARNFIDEAVSLGRRLSKQKQPGRPLFVAIAGSVATGKSFFTFHLLATLKALQIGVVHLPFEIWLNSFESFPAAHPYRDKFFLSRYCSDIADLHNYQEAFIFYTEPNKSKKIRSVQKVDAPAVHAFHGREYLPCSLSDGSNESLYVEADTSIVVKRITIGLSDICVVDGTLAFENAAIASLFSERVYITRSWKRRVIGIQERFRQNANHDESDDIKQYIRYLIQEATTGADDLIARQLLISTLDVQNDA